MTGRGRAVWLVDAAYLFNAQKSVRPDYGFSYAKLRAHLEKDGEITQAYYVNSTRSPPTDQQDAFHTWLKTARPDGPQMIVRLHELKEMQVACPACGERFARDVQKGVDVAIATLALKLAYQDRYDTLLLSTGDGDFEDMVDHVRNALNKRVELVAFRHGVSPDLQSYADRFHWIDDFAEDVERDGFEATCSACHAPTTVRFEPDGVRPVYCRECLAKRRASPGA